jgi:rare lipoprotein A (peptidoglycan hydrolase)
VSVRPWIAALLLGLMAGIAHARSPAVAGDKISDAQRVVTVLSKKQASHKGLSGRASYYANRFQGRETASGHLYYKSAMTAAPYRWEPGSE